ncbi:MAG: glutamate synthase subunit beta [Candidatus Omnitrophota bacterium]
MNKDIKAFLKIKRKSEEYRPVCERAADYRDVCLPRQEGDSKQQASRCMDCGVPFCHWACPVGNYIPEWNDSVMNGQWKKALSLLEATNNLPEITGRVCPGLCEYGCVLGINDDPVTIRENELSAIEYAFSRGLIKPLAPSVRTGKKVAVAGSGPAGLSAAGQLNKAGHRVVVFEKDKKPGGILRYGIPDFKLEKEIIERRISLLQQEGVEFKCQAGVGENIKYQDLEKEFDAIVIASGSRTPRDLKIEGRDLKGIHFAMDYLTQNNRKVSGEDICGEEVIEAKGKKVVVIGGGDTGSDCVGTANRQGASCVVQIEVLSQPPECRASHQPWPLYPLLLKTTSSHQEGVLRRWAVLTKKFIGEQGCVKKLSCVKVEFVYPAKNKTCPVMKEIPGSEFEIEADLVILAVGFLGPEKSGLISDLGLELDERGNIKTNQGYMTSKKGIFSAGDCRRGQSLVVWAIAEGRRAAYHIDTYLMEESSLPFL